MYVTGKWNRTIIQSDYIEELRYIDSYGAYVPLDFIFECHVQV